MSFPPSDPRRSARRAAARSHARRAISRPLLPLVAASGLLAALPACSPSGAADAAVEAAPAASLDPAELAAEIEAMVEAFRPPSPSAASDELDAQLAARRRWLGEARSRPPAFAAAVLDAWRERPEAPAPVQSGLLEAAAIADPESAAPVLVDLVSRYGPELQVRTDACRILGAHCPEVALELFPPILEDPQRSSTAPPDDAMLSAWLTAVRSTGADPGRLLTFLATDQQRGHATRHLAIRALGDFPGRVTIAALEEVLMESSGNAYMRRLAAQSIVKVGASEEVCPILQRVYDREADLNFQLFLHAVIEENCP